MSNIFEDVLGLVNTKQRFFLDTDNSGHWYLIDASYRKEWDVIEWEEFNSNEHKIPVFAKMLNYNITKLEFSNPTLNV